MAAVSGCPSYVKKMLEQSPLSRVVSHCLYIHKYAEVWGQREWHSIDVLP